MNVDIVSPVWLFLFINGPGAVILLYWASNRSCDYIIVQVGFLIELPVQRILCLIFVKLWLPVNGTQRCGIELHDIYKLFVS